MIINEPDRLPGDLGNDLFQLACEKHLPEMESLLRSMAEEYFPKLACHTACNTKTYGPNISFVPEMFLPPYSVSSVGPKQAFFNVNSIRKDFPILKETINGNPLIWFDNAATTQKPRKVIERIRYFYEHENSNVHRAAHTLAAKTTDAYEGAREKTASFLNAASPDEIIFLRGTTEAINLVAQTYGVQSLSEGDEVIVSLLEHHANLVPWQIVCQKTGAKLRAIPVDDGGQLILEEYEKLLNSKTKIVAVTHVSNVLGTITPVKEIIQMAHSFGAKVLVDGAQAAAHLKVDVQTLDCDFYAFSSHKLYGPTGVGVLYGKSEHLESMPPYQGGGNMKSDVTLERTVYKDPPHRFEAGTGNIADVIALESAIDYVQCIGLDSISQYEHELLEYAREEARRIPGLTLLGNAEDRIGVLSFHLHGMDSEKVGRALDQEGIAVRTGHHCAQPTVRRFGLEGTVRASFALYNTHEEIDFFIRVLYRLARDKSK